MVKKLSIFGDIALFFVIILASISFSREANE